MDQKTARYIIIHFPNLMTEKEWMARSQPILIKNTGDTEKDARQLEIYKRQDKTDDIEVLNLLKDGYDFFELNTAIRILAENPEKVFLNTCDVCGRLARTPYARQCRCGHDWHQINVAKFKLTNSFQITGRQFFLAGEITQGEAKIGNYIDLTMLGLYSKPKIEAIEYVLKNEAGKAIENICLGTNELSESDKEHLKNLRAFGTPFDIVNER